MNEETLFNYIDQLVLEAQESHREYNTELSRCRSIDDLIEELRILLVEHDAGYRISWPRVFLLAVFGEKYVLDS